MQKGLKSKIVWMFLPIILVILLLGMIVLFTSDVEFGRFNYLF